MPCIINLKISVSFYARLTAGLADGFYGEGLSLYPSNSISQCTHFLQSRVLDGRFETSKTFKSNSNRAILETNVLFKYCHIYYPMQVTWERIT